MAELRPENLLEYKRQSGKADAVVAEARYEGDIIYQGEWINGAPCGEGKITAPDSEYLGQVSNGKRQGQGVGKTLHESYGGYWDQDRLHGFGALLNSDGCYFIGNFAEGKKHGTFLSLDPKKNLVQAINFADDAQVGEIIQLNLAKKVVRKISAQTGVADYEMHYNRLELMQSGEKVNAASSVKEADIRTEDGLEDKSYPGRRPFHKEEPALEIESRPGRMPVLKLVTKDSPELMDQNDSVSDFSGGAADLGVDDDSVSGNIDASANQNEITVNIDERSSSSSASVTKKSFSGVVAEKSVGKNTSPTHTRLRKGKKRLHDASVDVNVATEIQTRKKTSARMMVAAPSKVQNVATEIFAAPKLLTPKAAVNYVSNVTSATNVAKVTVTFAHVNGQLRFTVGTAIPLYLNFLTFAPRSKAIFAIIPGANENLLFPFPDPSLPGEKVSIVCYITTFADGKLQPGRFISNFFSVSYKTFLLQTRIPEEINTKDVAQLEQEILATIAQVK